ncbi:hypothetical protein CPB84DRAFT_1847343 [Gymnopilus junonius]|uniref:Uncharacterized protein n=1 Tax=Gymnopilus junonius TaxID=109634 RepID=A0A9P5NKJ8_GYMJU|nr:hypothetical protein CPB84DRAFT_1847343 [Gymnopilus junonius]
MAPKYTPLPTDPAYSPTLRPDTPSYPPPYESSEEHPRLSFSQDIEEDAPRRGRVRREPLPAFDSDPRFRLPTPSPFARAGLLLFLFGMFYLAFTMRKAVWVAGGRGMNKDVPEVDPSPLTMLQALSLWPIHRIFRVTLYSLPFSTRSLDLLDWSLSKPPLSFLVFPPFVVAACTINIPYPTSITSLSNTSNFATQLSGSISSLAQTLPFDILGDIRLIPARTSSDLGGSLHWMSSHYGTAKGLDLIRWWKENFRSIQPSIYLKYTGSGESPPGLSSPPIQT